jgi:hypothetical protein
VIPSTLHDPRVAAALDRMFARATQDEATRQRLGLAADSAAMTAQEKAAVRDNGTGRVISAELSAAKVLTGHGSAAAGAALYRTPLLRAGD